MKPKTFLYAVQWIDHGGPYDEPQWESQIPTALEQMGFDPSKVLVGIGGIALRIVSQEEPTLFGCIETNVKLPKWTGMVKPSPRWVEEIVLWFYTFQPKEKNIVERFDFEDFDKLLNE
jgi:hypothetical protein